MARRIAHASRGHGASTSTAGLARRSIAAACAHHQVAVPEHLAKLLVGFIGANWSKWSWLAPWRWREQPLKSCRGMPVQAAHTGGRPVPADVVSGSRQSEARGRPQPQAGPAQLAASTALASAVAFRVFDAAAE